MTALAFRGVSVRVHTRSLVVCGVLVAMTLLAAVVSIGTGDFPLSAGEVVAVLAGQGDPASEFIVETLRLPRVAHGRPRGRRFGIAARSSRASPATRSAARTSSASPSARSPAR